MLFRSPRSTAPYQTVAWSSGASGVGEALGVLRQAAVAACGAAQAGAPPLLWPASRLTGVEGAVTAATGCTPLRRPPSHPTQPTRSKRSTSPTSTALGATQLSGASVGTRFPRLMSCRCRLYTSSSTCTPCAAAEVLNTLARGAAAASWAPSSCAASPCSRGSSREALRRPNMAVGGLQQADPRWNTAATGWGDRSDASSAQFTPRRRRFLQGRFPAK